MVPVIVNCISSNLEERRIRMVGGTWKQTCQGTGRNETICVLYDAVSRSFFKRRTGNHTIRGDLVTNIA